MKTRFNRRFLTLLVILGMPAASFAQGTSFIYQGRLVQDGVSADGPHDFSFTLHDAATDGNALGATVPLDAVMVNEGRFVASLDFGAGVFTGGERWLEISLRPAGQVDFTVLHPRQPVSPAPYAIHAGTAGSVAVGAVGANQLSTGGIAPSAGQFLTYDGAGFAWSDPGVAAGNIFSLSGNDAYFNTGNVGIGTSSPASKLTVSSPGYGIEQTDGTRRLSTYLSASGGWIGTRSAHPLNFYVNDGLAKMTIATNGNIGIGTTTPAAPLEVVGGWNGEQGALQLRGHRPSLRFTGDADSGDESWLLHLGDDGPFGFYRRTGPGAWNPVMQLPTNGRQMEIYGQDALGLIGFQPFLTMFDSSAGYAASRIQGAGGDLILETASYIAGQADTGLVLKNGTGFVGIGTTAPVAKLQAETTLPNTAAVYGKATGGGGVGVYGQSTSGAAVHAEGNATQARDKGGFVKAMAYIDPFLPAAQYVVRCYNSQQSGNATATTPCGITVGRISEGYYEVNFGFNVEGRFFSITPRHNGAVLYAVSNVSGNSVEVTFFQLGGENFGETARAVDSRFYITVY